MQINRNDGGELPPRSANPSPPIGHVHGLGGSRALRVDLEPVQLPWLADEIDTLRTSIEEELARERARYDALPAPSKEHHSPEAEAEVHRRIYQLQVLEMVREQLPLDGPVVAACVANPWDQSNDLALEVARITAPLTVVGPARGMLVLIAGAARNVADALGEALRVPAGVRVSAAVAKRLSDIAAAAHAFTNTRLDYQWRLGHLVRHLGDEETTAIDARRVDNARQKLVGNGLSARSVNMVLDLLAQVLDDAVEYKLIDANAARGKRRRMKVARSRRSFLEPDMVVDLLDVAGEWEASLPTHQRYGRRALLATLCIAGPRISELTGARRARLDLHGGRLRVGEAKTEAGLRDLELTAFLLDEIRAHLAAVPAELRDAHRAKLPILPTRTGGTLNASNVRSRLLKETVKRVNERREKDGRMLLPEKVTPHTLRRTFASLALAAGRDPRWVMGQLGHTDARLTLNVYAQVMQRHRVDEALIWQLMRFPDEPEKRHPEAANETRNETTGPSGATSRRRSETLANEKTPL